MKSIFAVLLMGFTAACLAEESCEPTVDLADSMNVNVHQDCNREKTGLNRLVHEMFRQNSSASSSAKPPADGVEAVVRSEQASSLVSSASELAEVRYQLLLSIGQQCVKGFRLTGEQYMPSDGRLRLNLHYQCL